MKVLSTFRAGVALGSLLALTGWADTLTLRDGTQYHGVMLSASRDRVVFDAERGGRREFNRYDVESIRFGGMGGADRQMTPPMPQRTDRDRDRDRDRGGDQGGGPIMATYRQWGGPTGALGAPTDEEHSTADGRGRVRDFERGTIFWAPDTGAHVVRGAIRDEYMRRGGPQAMGYPTSDQTQDPDGDGSVVQHFENGTIHWRAERGVW